MPASYPKYRLTKTFFKSHTNTFVFPCVRDSSVKNHTVNALYTVPFSKKTHLFITNCFAVNTLKELLATFDVFLKQNRQAVALFE